MSFFHEPEKASCKVYEGRTCLESLLDFVTKLPDTIEDGTIDGSHNKWKETLVIDLHKIAKNKYAGKGQMGVQITSEGRVIDYTWSFGQKTTRRLQNWCRGKLYNTKGGTVIAVTIHSKDWVIADDCFKTVSDDSVDESMEEE